MTEHRVGALDPLRRRAFRWLALGVFCAGVGQWMQLVGAQWSLVDEPNAAVLVSLVQAASTLPILLLALPGGVLADSFDRRWLLVGTQVHLFVVAGTLFLFARAGHLTAPLLLVFTFLLGLGMALQIPTWSATIPDLVPRSEVGAATRIDQVGVNLARALGPAIGGLLIAAFGVPIVFIVNAFAVVPLAATLLLWRGLPVELTAPRERFLPAIRAGGRYVRHSGIVRRILGRFALFVIPASAMWALLPLIASGPLGLGAAAYGLLFAALGGGAISGAFVLPRARERLSTNAILNIAMLLYAASIAALVVAPHIVVALVALVVAGLGWSSVASTVIAELQLFLPAWVRARGMGIYLMVFMGSQVAGSVLWGQAGQQLGVVPAMLASAGGVLVAAVAGLVIRVPETGHLDRQPASPLGEPIVVLQPPPNAPVTVVVEYTVRAPDQSAFVAAMAGVRGVRLRTGATSWELLQVAEEPERFFERFTVRTWEEHLRQHDGRLVGSDQQLWDAALAYSDPPAFGRHLVAPLQP